MFLWMNPRRNRAGRRCGYSSVDVTRIFQTLFQASYSSSCTGYTPEWWGAMEYPESTGIPCSLANSLLRVISISSCVTLSYRCGCWWFHMWLNHIKLPAFSSNMSSPRFSSEVPWWKYFPENPKLNRKPGTSCWIRCWVAKIASTSSFFRRVPLSPTNISSTSTNSNLWRLTLSWPWLRYDRESRNSNLCSQKRRPPPNRTRSMPSYKPWSCNTVARGVLLISSLIKSAELRVAHANGSYVEWFGENIVQSSPGSPPHAVSPARVSRSIGEAAFRAASCSLRLVCMNSGNPRSWAPTSVSSLGGLKPTIPTLYSRQYLSSSSRFHLSICRYLLRFSNTITPYFPLSRFVSTGSDLPDTSTLYLILL